MPIPLIALAAGAAALPQAAKFVSGIFGSSKGRRLEKNNIRPTYKIPGQFAENAGMARNDAQVGMPSAQYAYARNNINRNFASALFANSRNGGRGVNLNSMLRANNDATMGLDATSANMRMQNKRTFMNYNSVLGQQMLAKQQWDKFDKYNEMDAKAQGMIGAGRQNTMSGLDGLSQIAMSAAGQMGGGGDDPAAAQEIANAYGPNQSNLFNRMRGRGRAQYIGPMAQTTGGGNRYLGLNPNL